MNYISLSQIQKLASKRVVSYNRYNYFSFTCQLYNYLVNLFTCQLHKQLVYSSTRSLANYTSNLSTRLLVNLST